MHTFLRTAQGDGVYIYSVGCWVSRGACEPDWQPLRDCATSAEAALWVNYLNGGEFPLNQIDRVTLIDRWDNYTGEDGCDVR